MSKKFKFKPNKNKSAGASNGSRADKAEAVARQLAFAAGVKHLSLSVDSGIVSEALADLFHLCDREGWSVPEVIKEGIGIWGSER
jgi:hypothetical protein